MSGELGVPWASIPALTTGALLGFTLGPQNYLNVGKKSSAKKQGRITVVFGSLLSTTVT